MGMKIVFVNQPFDAMIPPYQNSLGLWTYHLAPFLVKEHHVTVYAKRNRMQKSLHDPSGVQYRFVACLPNRVSEKLTETIRRNKDARLPGISNDLYTLDYIALIALSARLQGVDVIHVHNFTQYIPVIRALYPRAKIVLHMHSEWLSSLDYQKMKERAEKADLILGSSDYITGLIRQRYPQLGQRCKTVHNGVDASLFKKEIGGKAFSNGAEKRLLFVGRVSPEKGVHVLIEAFIRLAEQYPQLHLDLAGPVGAMPVEYIVNISDDPHVQGLVEWYKDDYGVLLKNLIPPHLRERVHFLGNIAQAQLPAYYQNADVLVNPSFSESFGMSLIEAMAAEMPVVATRVGGMVEIVEDRKTGFLIEQGSPEALADAVAALLQSDDLRAQMGMCGRQRVMEMFDWSQVANRLLGYYTSLIRV
jgi:glycosyltransferase involved in cell wall biosynthesis